MPSKPGTGASITPKFVSNKIYDALLSIYSNRIALMGRVYLIAIQWLRGSLSDFFYYASRWMWNGGINFLYLESDSQKSLVERGLV